MAVAPADFGAAVDAYRQARLRKATAAPRPGGVAVNRPAGGVPTRLRPPTPCNVEPVSPT